MKYPFNLNTVLILKNTLHKLTQIFKEKYKKLIEYWVFYSKQTFIYYAGLTKYPAEVKLC